MPAGIPILLVEDERIVAADIARKLTRWGYRVTATVERGEDCLQAVREDAPALVLMDFTLAGEMDGIDAAMSLKPLHVPVVFLSGHTDPLTLDRLADANPSGYVTKPVDDFSLRSAIHIALAKAEAERDLREAEARYRRLFENAGAGIAVITPAGAYLAVNPAMATLFGYASPEEMQRLVKRIDQQVYVREGRFAELLAEIEANGEVSDFESQVYGRDGDAFWISENARVRRDATGRTAEIESFVIDITTRKDAEQAYAATFDLLQRTIDALPDMVCLSDLDGAMILGNAAFKSAFGLGEDAQGVSCTALLHENGESVSSSTAGPGGGSTNIITHDGLKSVLHETVAPFTGPEGEVIGAVRIVRRLVGYDPRTFLREG